MCLIQKSNLDYFYKTIVKQPAFQRKMTKVSRYFTAEETNSTEESEETKVKKKPFKAKNRGSEEIITYNVVGKSARAKWHQRKAKRVKNVSNPNPKYPGRAPIPEELIEKHSRGEGIGRSGVRTGIHKRKQQRKEQNFNFANEQAARVEILLTEDVGFLEADAGETTTQFTQQQILNSVDITAATKHFELQLNDFGPYRMKYTRNGRHLLLGGKLGHVAGFDWVTKKLHFEMNVMETVHDVCWLHIETMLAVAQKNWVYIYDNQGIELHCLKKLNKVSRMEFLPYHFLLAAASDEGYLSWLDVSIGQMVAQYNTKLGRLNMLAQNPYNALLCLGHSKGVVSMWAPNTREPAAKMLCHKSAMTALHIDPKGLYMATAGTDRTLKIWDIRKLLGPIQNYKLQSAASNVAFSQKNMLAVGMGNIVEVYRDCCTTTSKRAYLRHRLNNSIGNLGFCPYEDVLGVASARGFTSLLVPGAGEANFDAFEANPFQTKSQRREAEVKSLLEKIQPDLITLDPTLIAEVDVPTLRDKVDAKKKLLFLKPPKINYEPRNKAKGKGGSVKIAQNKKIVQEEAKRDFIKNVKKVESQTQKGRKTTKKQTKPMSVLDRFLPKQSSQKQKH